MPDSYPQKKSILITGGTGFLGSRICGKALELGYEIVVLTRNAKLAKQILPTKVSCCESLEDIKELEEIACVVNLAGEPLANRRWNKTRKKEFLYSRVGTTQAMYDHFLERSVKLPLLLSGSAVGYYGPNMDKILDESAVFHDSFSHQLCAAWEASANQFAEQGTRVCLIRTGIVLDEKEGALAQMLPAFRLGVGGQIGHGKQWMPWIHIDDFVSLVFHCIRRSDLRGAINATAPKAVTNKEFTKTLGSVLHRPTVFRMVSPVAKLLFGEMAKELLLTGQRVFPRKAIESGFEFEFSELKPALQNLLVKS